MPKGLRQEFAEEAAPKMFAAYNAQAGGKTWDNKPIPPWEEVGEKVHANWQAAAGAAYDLMNA